MERDDTQMTEVSAAPSASAGESSAPQPEDDTATAGEETPRLDRKRKQKLELPRNEAGRRLATLGNALAGDGDIDVDVDGEIIALPAPVYVRFELIAAVGRKGTELDLELKW